MYLVTIQTKRFLRKPLIELFEGDWKDEAEIRRICSKYRPRAEILIIKKLVQTKQIFPKPDGEGPFF